VVVILPDPCLNTKLIFCFHQLPVLSKEFSTENLFSGAFFWFRFGKEEAEKKPSKTAMFYNQDG